MKNLLLPLLTASLLFAACGGEPAKNPTTPTAAGPKAGAMDDHGERKPLGDLTIGTHTFALIQYGAIEAGKEASFDLEFPAGKALPGTVRAWVGVESGQGSMKARLAKEGDRTVHGHVQVPKPIPEGSKVWIEIEEGGAPARGSTGWKP